MARQHVASSRVFHSLMVLLILMLSKSRAQLHLFNSVNESPFSPECRRALAAKVDCTVLETGSTMYTRDADLTVEILDRMCTEQCKTSLRAYRKTVEAACENDEFDTADNATMQSASGVHLPIVLSDYYLTNYNQRCLADSKGEYCAFRLQEAEKVDHCDECNLWTFREKLDIMATSLMNS
ncbi:hypothetical protein BDW69DRAFT_134047 [Aspergillus filifer]